MIDNIVYTMVVDITPRHEEQPSFATQSTQATTSGLSSTQGSPENPQVNPASPHFGPNYGEQNSPPPTKSSCPRSTNSNEGTNDVGEDDIVLPPKTQFKDPQALISFVSKYPSNPEKEKMPPQSLPWDSTIPRMSTERTTQTSFNLSDSASRMKKG